MELFSIRIQRTFQLVSTVVFAGRHQIHVIDAGFSCIPIHINSIGYIQMSLYPANIIRKNIEDSIIYFLCYYSYGIMIIFLRTNISNNHKDIYKMKTSSK